MDLLISFSGTVWAVLALLLIAYFFLKKNKRDPRYPPGPTPISLLGNLWQLGSDPRSVFQKWAIDYGSIYSIQMGTQDTVIINDPKLVKELFSNNNSSGRTINPVFNYFGGGNGIINNPNHTWEAQRSFTIRKLRTFGVLNSSNEGFLNDEAEALIKSFELRVGKQISGLQLFNGPVINGLWRIISGESCNWDSDVKPEIAERAEYLFESSNKATILFFAPFLRHIAPNYFGWTDWKNSVNAFFELIGKTVAKHSHHLDPNDPKDFIDYYLVKIRKTTDPKSTFYQESGLKNLETIVGDLFMAGSETSSTTLSFAILYLILNQEEQRNAQQELDRVVGSSRQVALSDRALLPYTEAIILETLRLSSIIPLGVPHRMIADTMFHGYFLPKDVTVISDLYTIHHDPTIWGEDVNEFRPQRFLSEDKTRVIRHEALMPFCAGKRVCLGESLARDTIFMFIASILQRFDIKPDPDCPVLKVETVFGITVEPKPFKFVLSVRTV